MRKKTKFFLLRTAIILAFTILAGRLWYLQVVMANYYKVQADTSKLRLEPVQALRGIIYDRDGRQLVMNGPSWNVEIVPHGVPDSSAKQEYATLSRLLGGNPSAPSIAWMVWHNRWQPYAPVLIKRAVPSDTAMVIKQLHSSLPGIRADPATVRHYVNDPQLSLAHLLGYAGKINAEQYTLERKLYPEQHVTANDQAGQTAIEAALDPYLHGVNGTDQVEVDAGERPIRTVRHGTTIPGDSVYLTIDSKLQAQVAADLQTALNRLNVRQGIAVVEDVHTGQILAMVSLPSFDNNWFAPGITQHRYDALLHDPGHPLDNLATAGQFPPGSTFKVVTAAAALQTHVADATRTIDDAGFIRLCSVYDPNACQVFDGWQPGGLGSVNIVMALAKSSDIYFYTVAGGNPNVDPNMPYIGADRLAHWSNLFGLGQPSGLELQNEDSPGFIPTVEWYQRTRPDGPGMDWHIGQTYNMAIGQGFDLTTPIQMANVAATIANGGTLYRPRLVYQIKGRVEPRIGTRRRVGVVQPFVPSIVRRNFISPDNLQLIQEGMHQAVDLPGYEGTSYEVRDPRIDAAGKTGTAEAPGGPDAWWIGYAPFQDPKIAVAVLVPNANSEGAAVSAPIAHKIFEDYFHLPAKPNPLNDVTHLLVGSSTGRAG